MGRHPRFCYWPLVQVHQRIEGWGLGWPLAQAHPLAGHWGLAPMRRKPGTHARGASNLHGKLALAAGVTIPFLNTRACPRLAVQTKPKVCNTSKHTLTCSAAVPLPYNTSCPGTPPAWVMTLFARATIPCATDSCATISCAIYNMSTSSQRGLNATQQRYVRQRAVPQAAPVKHSPHIAAVRPLRA